MTIGEMETAESPEQTFILRHAAKKDCARIRELVLELAAYEKAAHEVVVTVEELEETGFGATPTWFGAVVEYNGRVEGMALCYVRFSTWKGDVLYLEDLVVSEAMRGKGAGKLLFEWCVEETKRRGYRRMAWQVLDWNKPAIAFYEKYGARLDPEWINATIDV